MALLTPIRAVTLDLDGTLVDSVVDLAAACDAMLLELGRPAIGRAQVHRFVGKGMAVLVERCLTHCDGCSPAAALLAEAITIFRRHYARENGRQASLYPGVVAGLAALRAQGLPLAVVTNKPTEFTGVLIERIGLSAFFDLVVCGDTTPEKKPLPGPLQHACASLGVQPAENLHIGDSDNDTRAARAAGCRAWAVPYGYTEEGPVDSSECDALVSDLLDAAQRVAEHNRSID